jgi:hypothetical protein
LGGCCCIFDNFLQASNRRKTKPLGLFQENNAWTFKHNTETFWRVEFLWMGWKSHHRWVIAENHIRMPLFQLLQHKLVQSLHKSFMTLATLESGNKSKHWVSPLGELATSYFFFLPFFFFFLPINTQLLLHLIRRFIRRENNIGRSL